MNNIKLNPRIKNTILAVKHLKLYYQSIFTSIYGYYKYKKPQFFKIKSKSQLN